MNVYPNLTLRDFTKRVVDENDDIVRVEVEDTMKYAANRGIKSVHTTHNVTVTVAADGGLAVRDVVRLTVDQQGVITSASLELNQPFWAVEAVRRALA